MFQISFPTCFQHVFKTLLAHAQENNVSANINNTLRFVSANVSQKMFPSLPTLGNMKKID